MFTVFCMKRNDLHDFYIADGRNDRYLFSQKYKKIIDDYYRHGVALNKAITHSGNVDSKMIHHTMEKLKLYIKYLEREHEIVVLNCTKRKVYGIDLKKEMRHGNYRF